MRFHSGRQDAHWTESNSLGVDVNLMSVTMRQPLGVAGIIIPWNSPMMLGTWKLAPCLAVGLYGGSQTV